MNRPLLTLFGLLCCVLLRVPVGAHDTSQSYLYVAREGSDLALSWDVRPEDLNQAVPLDQDGDGNITWGEVTAARPVIRQLVDEGLSARQGQAALHLFLWDVQMSRHGDGLFLSIQLSGLLDDSPAPVTLTSNLLFDRDALHRCFVSDPDGAGVQVLTNANRIVECATDRSRARLGALGHMIAEGAHHIWIGLDHILFLLALLLPSVLRREDGKWKPSCDARTASIEVLKVVSAFTIAHSITLAMTVAGLVLPSSRAVESVIAASIVLAAIQNFRPILRGRGWILAFGFGLVHGFGFASVLSELPRQSGLLTTLVGFNLGVEAGQLAIVAAFFPIAWWLRETWLYRNVVFLGGSALVALTGFGWCLERSLALGFMPV